MIKADTKKGEIICSGGLDEILAEYTILTKLIVRQLTELTDEEKALDILSKLGLIAINDKSHGSDVTSIYNSIDEVMDNDLQI